MSDIGAEIEFMVRQLGLKPHPEGGYYRETFRDEPGADGRAVSTAIYYLLPGPEPAAWHRVDAAETWHHYAGSPLRLSLAENPDGITEFVLGSDLENGHRPQWTIGAGLWQRAQSLGAWTLAGCTVAPGFEFSGFELAGPDWQP